MRTAKEQAFRKTRDQERVTIRTRRERGSGHEREGNLKEGRRGKRP